MGWVFALHIRFRVVVLLILVDMNLLGKLDLGVLLFSESLIMLYNFVQVLVLKNYTRCNLAPNDLKIYM